MRWKPAILLCLLLLVIGGGMFYQKLSKERHPDFTEVHEFFKHSAASGDWTLFYHENYDFRRARNGWWDSIGIHRKQRDQNDLYTFNNKVTKGVVLIVIAREDGKMIRVGFSGHSRDTAIFNDVLSRKFPTLRPVLVVNP